MGVGDVDADLGHRGTATGLIWSAGSDPAERTSMRSPARCWSQPAAIWDRPALWTHTNRGRWAAGRCRGGHGVSWAWSSGTVSAPVRLAAGGGRVEVADQHGGERAADELGEHEPGHRGGADAREGVGEHPGDGDGGVGETGRGGEPVGGGDVAADGEARRWCLAGAQAAEDDERRVRRWRRPRRAAGARRCGRWLEMVTAVEVEHQVRDDRTGHTADDLGGDQHGSRGGGRGVRGRVRRA